MQPLARLFSHPPVSLYERLIARQKGNSVFTILIFFTLAFGLSRLAVYLYRAGLILPDPFLNFYGTHIHHFVFGIVLIACVGFILLILPAPMLNRWHLKLSALYGFGLGWIVDEFGMWLKLENNYYLRSSYDALIITFVLLLNFVYFRKIWSRLFYALFPKSHSPHHLGH